VSVYGDKEKEFLLGTAQYARIDRNHKHYDCIYQANHMKKEASDKLFKPQRHRDTKDIQGYCYAYSLFY